MHGQSAQHFHKNKGHLQQEPPQGTTQHTSNEGKSSSGRQGPWPSAPSVVLSRLLKAATFVTVLAGCGPRRLRRLALAAVLRAIQCSGYCSKMEGTGVTYSKDSSQSASQPTHLLLAMAAQQCWLANTHAAGFGGFHCTW